MPIFQIKRIISLVSSEKGFKYVVTFFFENAKNLGRSDDPKRRKKRGWPNNVGPAGAESLATALKTNTTLTNLDLSSNNLGPVGAESLAKALETNTALKILSF